MSCICGIFAPPLYSVKSHFTETVARASHCTRCDNSQNVPSGRATGRWRRLRRRWPQRWMRVLAGESTGTASALHTFLRPSTTRLCGARELLRRLNPSRWRHWWRGPTIDAFARSADQMNGDWLRRIDSDHGGWQRSAAGCRFQSATSVNSSFFSHHVRLEPVAKRDAAALVDLSRLLRVYCRFTVSTLR